MKIPFNNLEAQYKSIRHNLDEAIASSLHTFNFIKGKEVFQFEKQFAELLKVKHCISTSNGTASLFISLKQLGIGAGHEVITPAFSWISSSETITLCGANPVFVDVDPLTYTLDPTMIEAKITSNTRAIIVVHLYGQAAHAAAIKNLCKKHKLFLIEDCAQAQLTAEEGKYVGTFGDTAAFSFYPTKNLGAYGDAGCVVTNNDALADNLKRFTNHGALDKDDHVIEGINSRMGTIQAAILLAKVPHLKSWNERRISNAAQYNDLLKDVKEIVLPHVRPVTTHTFHLYVIRCKQRDKLKSYLEGSGIQTIIHYPKSLPNLAAYSFLNHKPQDFPVSTMLQEEVLSLPIHPEISMLEIAYICKKIKEFYII